MLKSSPLVFVFSSFSLSLSLSLYFLSFLLNSVTDAWTSKKKKKEEEEEEEEEEERENLTRKLTAVDGGERWSS